MTLPSNPNPRSLLCSRLAITLFLAGMAVAQSTNGPDFSRKQLPGKLPQLVDIGSDRFDRPGRGRIQLLASVQQFTPNRLSTVRLSQEWKKGLRVDNLTENNSFIYSGNGIALGRTAVDDRDLAVSEMFAHDSLEGLIDQAATGSRVRFVQHNVLVQDPRPRNPLRGACDLYEVSDVSRLRGNVVRNVKTFCFDPVSGLLRSVVYQNGNTHVETRYEQWQTLQGQPFPKVLTRIENDVPTLQVTVNSATVGAVSNDNLFRTP